MNCRLKQVLTKMLLKTINEVVIEMVINWTVISIDNNKIGVIRIGFTIILV